MLKVTYGQLRDHYFANGMMKLANCGNIKSVKAAYNLARVNDKIKREAKLADDIFTKLVGQYAQKDADGNIEPHNGRPGTFFIPEDRQAEWEVKIKEFSAITLEIERYAVELEDVCEAHLTPMEIGALEPILRYVETIAEVSPLK